MARIKTWTEISGGGADMILERQLEMKKNGSTKKNLGVVINIIVNEYCSLLKKKK